MASISAALQQDGAQTARRPDLCGADGAGCIEIMQSVWRRRAAGRRRASLRPLGQGCRFTSLHGYEYTATPDLAKIHHNVIFRNATVPEKPIAWIDEPDVYGLWEKLRDRCTNAGTGCDVVTLPHNSNLSNGNMFATGGRDLPLEAQRDRAHLRADLERLVEINQIKGDSDAATASAASSAGATSSASSRSARGPEVPECGPDEVSAGALVGMGCVSRRDYSATRSSRASASRRGSG